jgi:putative isomerase
MLSDIIPFLKQVYPYIVSFHNWWYTERDHNNNGLCEYGSTDGNLIVNCYNAKNILCQSIGRLQTAKWESGMDNSARFDNAKIVQNSPSAYLLINY